jgi:HlyD family secretion protein
MPAGTRKWWVLLLACAALAMFAVAYSSEHSQVEVKVITPQYQEIESTVSARGTVVPANDFQARATFPSVVDEICVHQGEKVHAGQLLIRIKDQFAVARIQSARAALNANEVTMENMEKNGSVDDRIGFTADLARAQEEQKSAASALGTLKQLKQRGSASAAEVLAAEQRLDAANAALQALKDRTNGRYSSRDLSSLKSRIAADKLAVRGEQISYDNANIKSPISGTVYLIPVLRYDFVPMGAELLHVADLSKLYVRANFLEQDVGQLKAGQQVRITWDGNTNRDWHGHIVTPPLALTHVGDLNVGQTMIEVDDGRGDLPVNTNVTVVVTVAKHTRALTIPRQALHRDDSSAQFVYLLKNGKLNKTPVKIGVVNPDRAEITSGIQAEDAIALYGVNHQPLTDHLQAKAAE